MSVYILYAVIGDAELGEAYDLNEPIIIDRIVGVFSELEKAQGAAETLANLALAWIGPFVGRMQTLPQWQHTYWEARRADPLGSTFYYGKPFQDLFIVEVETDKIDEFFLTHA